ncbi:DUF6431 domain-containing protein [Robinsoniella peoriensis]|uniref:DUF6431 domain-containing protein n=1 Tax=Robinsoniella peoriensis TaxID=180332 RepID=UPI00366F1ECF
MDFGNPVSQDFYDKTINNLPFHQHSGCHTIHGYYDRNIKAEEGAVRLHICRVKCCHCGSTHALLPAYIVPYSQVSLPDQVDIISCYENSDSYSAIMAKTSSIDENCIYSLIRRYVHHWLLRVLSASRKPTAMRPTPFRNLTHISVSNQFTDQFIKINPHLPVIAPAFKY